MSLYKLFGSDIFAIYDGINFVIISDQGYCDIKKKLDEDELVLELSDKLANLLIYCWS